MCCRVKSCGLIADAFNPQLFTEHNNVASFHNINHMFTTVFSRKYYFYNHQFEKKKKKGLQPIEHGAECRTFYDITENSPYRM